MMQKIYCGARNLKTGKLEVQIHYGYSRRRLNPRFDLYNHSPTGFECGYEGSGPAQLALAILADLLDDDEQAVRLHQFFKRAVIARLARDGDWELHESYVRQLVEMLRSEHGNEHMNHPLDPFTYILVDRKPVNHPNDDDWFLWFGNMDNRRVAWTKIDHVYVSTIFGGIDRSYGLHGGPPQLFETHIFGGEHDDEEWLTSTWEQAEAKHAEVVRMLKSEECES